MKKVEFEHIYAKVAGIGLNRFTNVEETIQNRVEQGWTFEGYVPLEQYSQGEVCTISLIFTKEE